MASPFQSFGGSTRVGRVLLANNGFAMYATHPEYRSASPGVVPRPMEGMARAIPTPADKDDRRQRSASELSHAIVGRPHGCGNEFI